MKSGLVYAMGNHDFRNGCLEGARVEIGSLLFGYSLTDKIFSQGSWRGSTNWRGLGSFNSSSHLHDVRKKGSATTALLLGLAQAGVLKMLAGGADWI